MTAASRTIHDPSALARATARVATAHASWSAPALWVFLLAYVALGGLTWWFYLRPAQSSRRSKLATAASSTMASQQATQAR
jgi:Tfp pilus assembly protein PilO